jgi:asparagine synthase (glutamine-hydrolysing)
LYNVDKTLVLAVNGEIYNHQSIRKNTLDYNYLTQSDCEVLLSLYQDKGVGFLNDLNGIFAFALYDVKKDCYLIARDYIGIIPMYIERDDKGQLFVASELKALEGVCKKIEEFKPGHYWLSTDDAPVKWYNREWIRYDALKKITIMPKQLNML